MGSSPEKTSTPIWVKLSLDKKLPGKERMKSPCLNPLDLPLKTWSSPLLRIAEQRKKELDSNSPLFKLLSSASQISNSVLFKESIKFFAFTAETLRSQSGKL